MKVFYTMMFMIVASVISLQAGPVSYYGQMEAHGTRIYGAKNGLAMEARGVSLYWNTGGWGGEGYWNSGTVNALADDWKVDMVRAAFDPNLWPGNQGQMEEVIQAAIDKDIYVIVDFHTHNPDPGKAEWFFGALGERFGDVDNIIWEVYNEPESYHTWEGDIKPHSERAIASIRQHSDNLIVVGNRIWSQRADEAAANPVDDPNVAYVMHFYVGSHGSWVKEWNEAAMGQPIDPSTDAKAPVKPVAIFASEWGYWPPGADNYKPDMVPFGQKDFQKCYGSECSDIDMSGYDWMDFMAKHQMSWASWSMGNKNEPSSFFNGSMDNRTPWGNFIRDHTRNWTENRAPWNFSAEVKVQGTTLAKESLIDNLDDVGTTNFWNGQWSIEDDSAEKGGTHVTPITQAIEGETLILSATFEYDTMWEYEPYAKVVMTLNAAGAVEDMSGCSVIQYDYKGKAHNFQVAQEGVEHRNYHSTEVAQRDEWSTAVVDWNNLKQPGWVNEASDIDASQVKAFVWLIKGAGGTDGELAIDNITCLDGVAPAHVDYTDEVPVVESSSSKPDTDESSSVSSSSEMSSDDEVGENLLSSDDYEIDIDSTWGPGREDVSPITYDAVSNVRTAAVQHISPNGTISLSTDKSGTYQVTVFSLMGERMVEQQVELSQGNQQLHTINKAIPSGAYVVQLGLAK
ncbi:MAG: glycoside hydrolase family 5 protein [Fibrobacterales bacterium]